IPGPVEPVSPGPAGTSSGSPAKAAQLHQTSLATANTHCDPHETKGRGRPRRGKQEEEEEEEEEVQAPSGAGQEEKEPAAVCDGPPISPAPVGKFKNAKRLSAVEPLEEGEELTDTAGRKWRLGKLLSQTTTDLIYEVFSSNSKDSEHIVKLGTKDGRIFNEQNFLQRAAKPASGPSQRSDLQSLGYCMLHWHTGTLPWATLTDPEHIGREKQRLLEDVPALLSHCFGKKRVSSAMQQYLTRVMALGYTDTPDYTMLKAGLHDALLQLGGALEQPLSF
ncbi:hypothetical protein CRUP_010400, partial [Coryphaenoides rupestris]